MLHSPSLLGTLFDHPLCLYLSVQFEVSDRAPELRHEQCRDGPGLSVRLADGGRGRPHPVSRDGGAGPTFVAIIDGGAAGDVVRRAANKPLIINVSIYEAVDKYVVVALPAGPVRPSVPPVFRWVRRHSAAMDS